MRDLDRLPPDQRAVLSLVLQQDRSFQEVASMLGIAEESVRQRAHAALDVLASEPGTAQPAQAQQPPAGGAPAAAAAKSGRDAQRDATGDSNSDAIDRDAHQHPHRPGSRLGGALLLGAIVAAIAVAAIVLSSSKGGKSGAGATATPTSSTATPGSSSSGSSSSGNVKIDKTLSLAAVQPGGRAAGRVYVVSQNHKHAFYVAAAGLAQSKGFFYAVWLYNSPTESAPLGRAPAVGSDGRMEGGDPLPPNASRYHRLIITRETDLHATHPGTIVLSGAFSLR